MKKILIFVTFIAFLSGCGQKSFDKNEFIDDTNELISITVDVYSNGREYTDGENKAFKSYENKYEDIEDMEISTIKLDTIILKISSDKNSISRDSFIEDANSLRKRVKELGK